MDFGITEFEQRLPDADAIRTHAADTMAVGVRVHELMDSLWETWLRLTAPGTYDVAGNEKVFTALDASRTAAEKLSNHSIQIDTVMRTYAESVDLLKVRLGWVKERAEAFNREYPESEQDEWDNDQSAVSARNMLAWDVGQLHADLDEAQRDAAVRITHITGSQRGYIETDQIESKWGRLNGDTIRYGYGAEAYSRSLSGERLSKDLPWYRDTLNFVGDTIIGVPKAGWELVTGAGVLIGFQGWNKAGNAWHNMGRMTGNVIVVTSPVYLGSERHREAVDELMALGPQLIRYDQWNSDRPGLALGGNIFDAVTLFAGGAGAAGGAAKVGTKALGLADRFADSFPASPGGPGGFGGLTPALPDGHMPVTPRDLELPDNGILDRRGKGGGGKPFPDTYSPDSGRDPAIQPQVGDTDGGNGYFKDKGRTMHGAPEQQYFSGIDRVDAGHAREYILKDADGKEVEFDGHGWIGDPPKEYFPEIKGHYDWMWPAKEKEMFDYWIEDELLRQTNALQHAGHPGFIHELIFTEKVVMDKFNAYLPSDHPLRRTLTISFKPMP